MRFSDQIIQRFVLFILVTDDAEAQGKDHSWASDVRSTSQSDKNGAALEFLIRKVPNYWRLPPEQFTGKDSGELKYCNYPCIQEVSSILD
jgi:hypothetical protein